MDKNSKELEEKFIQNLIKLFGEPGQDELKKDMDKAKNLQNDPGDGSIVLYLIGLGLMLLFCILATILGFA